MTDWNSGADVIGPPAPKPVDPPFDSGAPTPEEVAAQIQAKQALLDAKRLSAGTALPPTPPPPPPAPEVEPPRSFAPTLAERAGPPTAAPAPQPTIPAPPPPPSAREPKHRMGAFLRIPGGFSGRVVQIYPSYQAVCDDPDVIAAGGALQVVRGLQGQGRPSTEEQPFYRCRSNGADYDLVVGELDAHLIQQGPDVPQE